MRKGCIYVMVVILCFLSFSCDRHTVPSKSDAATNWEDDLDVLAHKLQAGHNNVYHKMTKQQYNAAVMKLKKEIPHLTEAQIKTRMLEFIASIGDAHTNALRAVSRDLPVSIMNFSDGNYIVSTSSDNMSLLGSKITKVNGVDIRTIRDRFEAVIPHENEYGLEDMFPMYLQDKDLLAGYDLAQGDKVSFTIADLNGQLSDVEVPLLTDEQKKNLDWIGSATIRKHAPRVLYKQDLNYWYQIFPDEKTAYFQYNQCSEMKSQKIKDFLHELEEAMTHDESRKLIIDLRFNSGGNSELIKPLLEALTRQKELSGHIQTYVLIGPHTFSSAVLNAISFKQTLNATLVGLPTGEKPNSYGEIKMLELPHSHIQVSYSTKFFELIKGSDPAAVFPDVELPWTYQDWINGKDSAIDYCLAQPLPAAE